MYFRTINWSQWNLSEYVFLYFEHNNTILIYIAKWSPWSLMNTTGCFSLFKFYYVKSDIHSLLYIANCYTCIKHTIAYPCITLKTTDLATRIPLKTGGKLRCLGRDSSFWSTCDTLYAAVKRPEHQLLLQSCWTPVYVNKYPIHT